MMLHANDNFHDIRESIVKIFAMMTGEFEFEANFGWKAVDDIGGRNLSTQVKKLPNLKNTILHISNIGTFKGAINPHTSSFREFPTWWEKNKEKFQNLLMLMKLE